MCVCVYRHLFLGDAHVIGDVGEDGGLDVEALLAPGGPATLQRGPLPLPALHQFQDLIKLLTVDLEGQAEAHWRPFIIVPSEIKGKTNRYSI